MTAHPASSGEDSFHSLTPEGVLEAVEKGGLRTNPVCYPLNSFENRVYEVELEDRTRVIAKFYRPGRWSEEQILEEHRFLEDLAAEEVAVCPVRRFPDGSTLKRQGHIFYSLAERRGGRAPDELTEPMAERLGMLVGRLHNVGARRPAPHRLPLDADTFVRANLAWLDEHDVVPARLHRRWFDAGEALATLVDRLLADIQPEIHRLHGDLHLGNLLDRDGVLHVLDFDDMVTGPAVQDLWLALPGRDAWARRLRERFLEGYERFRLFDRRQLRLVEALRGLRMVHFATWLARRWNDPIFPVTWPQFGTEGYWDRETEDLEEQLRVARVEADPDAAPAAPEQEELGNADFFWDWEEN
ncbi:MAG TPA: serine/threonine protein kinase [Thermoanaerobaculia bacterium]|nr:serine/threonine protein kinase [Thermoanaerobaculia bacterium]